MSDFQQRDAATDRTKLDPTRHVNYVQGMVLGVEDFNQEFAYLAGHDHQLARGALGYGVVRGLLVRAAPMASGGYEAVVCPGEAVTPRGRVVRVPDERYATLGAWIAANNDAVGGAQVGGVLPLHVVLAYRECLTDPVPVPGEPCRTEEDSLQPSRIADHFELRLTTAAPLHFEDDALRALTVWLRTNVIVADDGESGQVGAALNALRIAVRTPADGFPPPSVDDGCASEVPLVAPGAAPYRVGPGDVTELLRQVTRAWVTEFRPRWHRDPLPRAAPSPEGPADDDEVLLATLEVPVKRVPEDGPWVLGDTAPTAGDLGRPSLAHLRLLQALTLQPIPRELRLEGDVTGALLHSVVGAIRGVTVDPEGIIADGRVMALQGGVWRPLKLDGDVSGAPGALSVDKLRGTKIDPDGVLADGRVLTFQGDEWTPVELDGEVSGVAGDLRVVGLRGTPVAGGAVNPVGAVLTVQATGWAPVGLDGDVTGAPDTLSVVKLRGIHIATAAESPLSEGHVLTYGSSAWKPMPLPTMALTGDVTFDTAPNTRVGAIQHHPVNGRLPAATELLVAGTGEWAPMPVRGDLDVTLETEPDGGDWREVMRATLGRIGGKTLAVGLAVPDRAVLQYGLAGDKWTPVVLPVVGAPITSYSVVATGTIPLNVPPPTESAGHGTPSLRTIASRPVTMSPSPYVVHLVEFTFDGYTALISDGLGVLLPWEERRKRFVVKATPIGADPGDLPPLAYPTPPDPDPVGVWITSAPTIWAGLGPVSVEVAYFSPSGIVLRVTSDGGTPAALDTLRLMVEVNYSPDFATSPA